MLLPPRARLVASLLLLVLVFAQLSKAGSTTSRNCGRGKGCGRYGTCNLELGVCNCAIPWSGEACEDASASASACAEHLHTLQSCASKYLLNCLNSCNNRGRCVGGVCVCRPGYYGADCALSLDDSTGKPVLLADQGYEPRALGPRVYVYELPPRLMSWWNVWANDKPLHLLIMQRLLATGARVTDGDTADWYLVPVHTRTARRVKRDELVLAAVAWVRQHYPWWDKLAGARHMFVGVGDLGLREFGDEVRSVTANSTWLTHWGLTQPHKRGRWRASHRPGLDIVMPTITPPGLVAHTPLAPWSIFNHNFNSSSSTMHPAEAAALAASQRAAALTSSSLSSSARASSPRALSAFPSSPSLQLDGRTPRDGLLYFSGRVCGHRQPAVNGTCVDWRTNKAYSAFTRQAVYQHHWNRPGFKLVQGAGPDYQRDLASHKFCLAPTGGGHGRRNVFVSLMGCVPVTVTDHVLQPYEPEMDWSGFSVALPEADIPRMHTILEDIIAATPGALEAMQAKLRCAAQHLYYSGTFGSLFGEDGRYDAIETLLELLRVRAAHPGLAVALTAAGATEAQLGQTHEELAEAGRRYREADERFKRFMDCELGGLGAGLEPATAGATGAGSAPGSATPHCGGIGSAAGGAASVARRGNKIAWLGGAMCCGVERMTDCKRHWQ